MNSKKLSYIMSLLTLVILSGCGQSTPLPTPTPVSQQMPGLNLPVLTQPAGAAPGAPAPAAAVPVGDLYQPIEAEECLSIHDAIAAALNTTMGITDKSLDEFAYFGVQGGACMIRTRGTGAEFDLVNTLAKIEGAITGWTPSDKYRIDTPISVSRGFTKGNQTLVIGISWGPTPESNCPIQIATTCPLTPEQKIFKIVVIAMQK